ncbi:MAG: methylated-DNA--[protein]-cysteine S-methyltransferase [Thermacetogeniaceae bacterium]
MAVERKGFKGVEILAVRVVPTPWGWAALAAGDKGIIRCSWPWPDALMAESAFGAAAKGTGDIRAQEFLEQAAGWLLAFFAGKFPETTDLPIDDRIFSEWQRKVYDVVKRIPFGEVRSYGWVARECGVAGAARAVGQALAKNPLPIFIPCHRVVCSDGRVGDYSCEGSVPSGEELKRQLIAWEQSVRG